MSYSTFMERVKKFMIRSESQEQRDARRIQRETNAETGLDAKEAAAEDAGNVHEVVTYLKKLNDIERKEAMQLFDIFVNMRIITLRHIYTLKAIEIDVHRNPKIPQHEKETVLRELEEYRRHILALVTTTFQNVTSIESTSVSLEQSMLGLGSQVRELFNNARKSRKDERRMRRDESKLASGARSAPEIGKLVKYYGADLKEEAADFHGTVKYALIVLRKLKDRVSVHHAHMHDLIEKAGFPKTIGEKVEEEFAHTKRFMAASLEDEVKKERIEISEAEHAKAA